MEDLRAGSIRGMKTYFMLAVVLAVNCCLLVSPSAGAGADSPRDSMVHADSLDRISVGVAYEKQKRDVEDTFGHTGLLESRHLYGFLAVDIFPWLTVRGGGGQTEVKPGKLMDYGDEGDLWMAGVRLNLWQHDVTAPAYLACRCRVQASGSYWEHDTDFYGEDLEWDEKRVALLFQAESFVESYGRGMRVYPYSVIFSAGPVYSEVDVDMDAVPAWAVPTSGRLELEEDDSLGILASVDVNFAYNFSMGWQTRFFDEWTHGVNLAFHF